NRIFERSMFYKTYGHSQSALEPGVEHVKQLHTPVLPQSAAAHPERSLYQRREISILVRAGLPDRRGGSLPSRFFDL
ncbi:MAG: hypothetical protein RBT03_04075, partial [Kiritimatiellia bacterium]|nr:hypothetical protein [Kiritimatiellia bacterium]